MVSPLPALRAAEAATPLALPRAYDPCLGCATHALPGHTPLKVRIHDHRHRLLREVVQD